MTIDISSLDGFAIIRVHNEEQALVLLTALDKAGWKMADGGRIFDPHGFGFHMPHICREIKWIILRYDHQVEYSNDSDRPPMFLGDYIVDFSELIVKESETAIAPKLNSPADECQKPVSTEGQSSLPRSREEFLNLFHLTHNS